MATQYEGVYPSDWLKWEEDKLKSRRNVVNGAVAVVSGEVVEGPDTAVIAWAGTNPAVGIALFDTAISGDCVIVWSEAIVNAATITTTQTDAATKTELLKLGIRSSDGIGLVGDSATNQTQPGPSAP